MKKLFFILALALPLTCFQTACQNTVTLEPGGVYKDTSLAVADQAILDASHALAGFVQWADTNATYLAQWPQIGALAKDVAAKRDVWVFDAYAARDAYARASAAYKEGLGQAPDKSKLNAALAVLKSVTTQVQEYKKAHSNV